MESVSSLARRHQAIYAVTAHCPLWKSSKAHADDWMDGKGGRGKRKEGEKEERKTKDRKRKGRKREKRIDQDLATTLKSMRFTEEW